MENLQQPQNPEPKPAPKKSPAPIGTYIVYALCVTAGILGTKIAFDVLAPRFKSQSAPFARAAALLPSAVKTVAPANAVPKTASPIDLVKKKVKQAIEPYELNGLYFCGSDSYALVNNKIAQVGEEVDGAEVVAIEKEEVQLRHNNKIIHLRSRNK